MFRSEFANTDDLDSTTEFIKSADFRQKLNEALVSMGKHNVHKQYRQQWSPEKPYLGYCYVVSELLYHILDKRAIPKVMPNDEGKHWYLELLDGNPLDLTSDEELDYSVGKRGNFLTREMSARTKKLLSLMYPTVD